VLGTAVQLLRLAGRAGSRNSCAGSMCVGWLRYAQRRALCRVHVRGVAQGSRRLRESRGDDGNRRAAHRSQRRVSHCVGVGPHLQCQRGPSLHLGTAKADAESGSRAGGDATVGATVLLRLALTNGVDVIVGSILHGARLFLFVHFAPVFLVLNCLDGRSAKMACTWRTGPRCASSSSGAVSACTNVHLLPPGGTTG
jgi:hypothetical protein